MFIEVRILACPVDWESDTPYSLTPTKCPYLKLVNANTIKGITEIVIPHSKGSDDTHKGCLLDMGSYSMAVVDDYQQLATKLKVHQALNTEAKG